MSSSTTIHSADARWLRVHDRDNVVVALESIPTGMTVDGVVTKDAVGPGHKIALTEIPQGARVIKYGYSIGMATRPIMPGDFVHSHNLATGLDANLDYRWQRDESLATPTKSEPLTFEGFRRADGRAAIRNEIWIINTVGCINMTASRIAQRASAMFAGKGVDGIYSFPHPFGCSQLGDDLQATQAILGGLIRHPNAAGVLVIGLGCENNQIRMQLERAGIENADRIRYFNAQEVEDEVEHGIAMVGELVDYASQFKRQPLPSNELILAMKCGGSDGFSGITGNPLVGRIADKHCGSGGTTILSEVPEMFGAEQLLMQRATSQQVFSDTVALINDFKDYFREHDQPVYENPSPGNKDGGLTTLEEKSLGCVQKAGSADIVQVLPYGQPATAGLGGVALVNSPGNDATSCTAMTAAGAHIILFTTGRGTPFGVPAPTVKISTNSDLATRKPAWIDFDAGRLLEAGANPAALTDELFQLLVEIASGKEAHNETNGYREIAVWKMGVTV
ncbi:UxaA family hydrolase [Planctomycetaceae bacterium SH139]